MQPRLKVRQSREFAAFRCIGADCEDTCCGDWGVSVDRQTYDKYQLCGDPEMQPLLRELVTLSPVQGNDEDFARIALKENRCPFLAEGLCSIQQKLGESYLSNTCSSFPRAVVVVDGTEERSLHLSCPEAARLALLNLGTYELEEQTDPILDDKVRPQTIPVLSSLQANRGGTPYPYFHEIRGLFLRVLQSGASRTWQRLAVLAQLSEDLNAILQSGKTSGVQEDETAEFVRRLRAALESGGFQVAYTPDSPGLTQIEMVLELILARIGSDFTTHRFLECYREFMLGLQWGPETTMEELNSRYNKAQLHDYAPFMSQHGYILDNFLVNWYVRSLFPYGHREIGQRLGIEYRENVIRRQYLLLAVHYAAVRTVLTGMAAFHGPGFGTGHVIKLVQSYAKGFLHSGSFPEKALQILSGHGIHRATEAVVLFQDVALAAAC